MNHEFRAIGPQLYLLFANLDVFDSIFNLFENFFFASVLVIHTYIAEKRTLEAIKSLFC